MADKKVEVVREHGNVQPMRGTGLTPYFSSLRQEVERAFDQFTSRFFPADEMRSSGFFGPLGDVTSPAVDLVEKDGAYEITAELPGLDPKAVQVTVSDGMLTLSGEKSESKEEKQKDYYLSERRYGSFRRAFPLPRSVDADKIEAQFDKGVLTVTLPKNGKAAPKTIEVKAA